MQCQRIARFSWNILHAMRIWCLIHLVFNSSGGEKMKHVSMVAICTLLLGGIHVTGAVAAGDKASMAQKKQITSLERRVKELEQRLETERRVTDLEHRLGMFEQKGTGATYWRSGNARQPSFSNWDMLKSGMAKSEVVKLLGRPVKNTTGRDFTYLRGGMVRFDGDGKLLRWRRPASPQGRYYSGGRSPARIGWAELPQTGVRPAPSAWDSQPQPQAQPQYYSPPQYRGPSQPRSLPVRGWDVPPQARPVQGWQRPDQGWGRGPQSAYGQSSSWSTPPPPQDNRSSGWGWSSPNQRKVVPYEGGNRSSRYWGEP